MQITSAMLWRYRSTIPRDEWSVDVDRARVTIVQNARADGNISSTSTRRSFRRISNTVHRLGRDANSVSLRLIVFLSLIFFSLSLSLFEIESRISLAERDASVQEIKLSIPRRREEGEIRRREAGLFHVFLRKEMRGRRVYSACSHEDLPRPFISDVQCKHLIHDG